MKIIYRISDAGYKKEKPDYIDNETCLVNASTRFEQEDWLVIADNCSDETMDMVKAVTTSFHLAKTEVKSVSVGHGAGTFN
jgi:hypothetical protein